MKWLICPFWFTFLIISLEFKYSDGIKANSGLISIEEAIMLEAKSGKSLTFIFKS